MYEDLEQLAQLKFIKQMEAIAAQTRENVVEAKRRFAATASPGIRSGSQDAELARLYIEGAEQMVRALFQIWVDLIKQRNGHVARVDIPFVAGKTDGLANTKKGHLRRVVAQQGSRGAHSLMEQADRRMIAAASNARRDLELMAREHEAFPNKEKQSMRSPFGGQDFVQEAPKRFSPGRRVLFGMANQVGTVQSAAGEPSQMGEFVHQLLVEKTREILPVLGCDMRPFPDVDEDLARNRPSINIQNVGNLNLGVQIGTITSALQNISQGDESQQRFAHAIEELTQTVLSDAALHESNKQEIVEAIATLSQEAAKNPGERSKGTLKALVAWLPTAITATNNLVALWEKLGPIIRGYLQV